MGDNIRRLKGQAIKLKELKAAATTKQKAAKAEHRRKKPKMGTKEGQMGSGGNRYGSKYGTGTAAATTNRAKAEVAVGRAKTSRGLG